MHADLTIPAPASWRRLVPTDAPVLRNDLWDAYRSITRGAWCLAVYGDHQTMRLVATQDCVVDDFGQLQPLSDAAKAAAQAWYASTFSVDVAASDWMGQFDPVPAGSPLHAMASHAKAAQPAAAAQVLARVLPEPHRAWYSASISVVDDLDWEPGQPLVSVEVEHDATHRLVLTGRQARALGTLLLSLASTACGGGGDAPDQPSPTAPCAARAEVCR